MFGFLKPRLAPGGPVEVRFDAVIERPAEDVYALIDLADPRNAQSELGNEITRVGGAPGRFTVILRELPDHRFEVSVTDEIPHVAYAFDCETVPMAGRLVRAHERYSLEPLTEGSCRLKLVMTATFVDALRLKEYEHEVLTMSAACRNAVAKLKILAEEGIDAARAVQGRLIA